MIRVTSRGNFKKSQGFLNRLLHGDNFSDLNRYGQMGVDALSDATPVDTGLTASSWDYRIYESGNWIGIDWFNTNQSEQGGPSIAVLIQYGHGTRGGTFISGEDYINPAMRSVFDEITNDWWKKVTA